MPSRILPFCLILTVALAMPGVAAEAIPSAADRYADAADQHTPDFQRHVLPLLGRLGCNGRDCHGSFQGQGGLRLSLFGYDFAADHAALTGGNQPRVSLDDPAASLILQKPTEQVGHEGGLRFARNGWEHELLRRWIAAGAKPRSEKAAELLHLEVAPGELVFATAGDQAELQVIADWSDGTREDVTPLCRFQSNDSAIAKVSENGRVTAAGSGDTHVVAFYDNGIVAVPTMLPVSKLAESGYPEIAAPTEIDRLINAKLRKLGIVPAELCTDAEFLRRVSLDITGTLPTPAEVTAFIESTSPKKREEKIEELLTRPSHFAWMTTQLCDWTGNSEQNLPVGGEQNMRRQKSEQWYNWIYRRVEQNVPYDELVAGIVMAVGRRPGLSDDEYYAERSSYFRTKNPADFSRRETMPYFWSRGRFTPPQTLRFSYAFLGVRLECAECHKHPYDQWTQQDYEDFQIFFQQVNWRQSSKRGRSGELKQELGLTADQDSGGYKRLFAKLAAEGTTVPWGELVAPNWQQSRYPLRKAKSATGRVITPRLLGGEALIASEYSDPRQPVMDWLQAEDNPYFSRALVNRVWAGYFGTGIINPTDDMNLANPAANEPLLDYLAREFVAQGYDLRWLHRTITNSHAYQRSWRPNESNTHDERNFSRSLVRRLPAEIMFDALWFATATRREQQNLQSDRQVVHARQIGFPSNDRNAPGRYAMQLFGKPARELVCDCERSNEPSLRQMVYLRNDAELADLLDRQDGWLGELSQHDPTWWESHSDEVLTEAWLRCFSRMPSDDELQIGRAHLVSASEPLNATRDLMWALLNSKEFLLNH